MLIRSDEKTDIETPTGTMRVHLFRPTRAGRFPAILLFSEIYQVTAPIERLAAMIAGLGYLVAVPEVYHEYEARDACLPMTSPAQIAETTSNIQSLSAISIAITSP